MRAVGIKSASNIREDCPFTPYWERAFSEGCWACGGALTGRQKKWCSKACSELWMRNHDWSYAKDSVLRLARVRVDGHLLYECHFCGSLTDKPEVDHIDAMNGDSRAGKDCRHHQANLRVLDHACHAERTAEQARERAGERVFA